MPIWIKAQLVNCRGILEAMLARRLLLILGDQAPQRPKPALLCLNQSIKGKHGLQARE